MPRALLHVHAWLLCSAVTSVARDRAMGWGTRQCVWGMHVFMAYICHEPADDFQPSAKQAIEWPRAIQ